MTIFGIDIGTTRNAPCAMALYEPHGDRVLMTFTIKPPNEHADIDARIGDIGQQISFTIGQCAKWQPVAIAYERAHVDKNIQTALKLAAMGGAVAMLARIRGLQVIGVQPSSAKVALCGYPSAKKTDMIRAANRQYVLSDKISEHEADAIGIALAGWAVYRLAHMARVGVV